MTQTLGTLLKCEEELVLREFFLSELTAGLFKAPSLLAGTKKSKRKQMFSVDFVTKTINCKTAKCHSHRNQINIYI